MHPTQKKNNNTLQAWCFFKKHKHQTKQKLSCFSKSFFSKKHQTKKLSWKKPRPCNNVCSATSHPKPPRRVNPVNPCWARCPPRGRPHPIRRCPGSTPKKPEIWGRWFSFVLCVFFWGSMLIFFGGVKLEIFLVKLHEMTDSCCWRILGRVH